jgi:hypothetical protein
MEYLAICDGLADSIYATGGTEDEADTILWELVHNYLVSRQAPETSEMSAAELQDFFGSIVINIKEQPSGFMRG